MMPEISFNLKVENPHSSGLILIVHQVASVATLWPPGVPTRFESLIPSQFVLGDRSVPVDL